MVEIMRNAWESYLQFKGVGMHMGLYFAVILFLSVFGRTKQEKENNSLLSMYSLLFWGIFFFPVTAKIIMEYCIGSGVYWRMFWILPVPLIVAYAFAFALKYITSKGKRYIIAVCMAIVIIMTGTFIYTPLNFSKAENLYKIPQSVVDVCQMINEDARENDIEEKKVVAVNELISFIRQYDGSMKMPYGRNGPKEGDFQNENSERIYQAINSPEVNFQELLKYAKEEQCNYLVYYKNESADVILHDLGCETVGGNEQYTVYRW